MKSARSFFVLASCLGLSVTPFFANALTLGEMQDITVYILYGVIGFFGALSFLLFFGGWTVYVVRLGQEYRLEGIYVMLQGVRVLFYVLCAIGILVLIE